MKKIFDGQFFYPTLLAIIISIVCLANFVPGTYLTGWDNLMPELNIWLNLKRSLFAVWQEYQGLGLVGGMGHATDLIRELIILPFTLILPTNVIRYLWHFSMLFLGTFGIYFLTYYGLRFKNYVSFLSSLFYLLNFGTIQLFWAPLETFSTFWGFFPWLVFLLWAYLDKPTLPSLIKLLAVNLLAIPGFYVQTIFIVYMFCVGLILLSHLIFHYTDYQSLITNYAKIILLILAINSFWLVPQVYFLTNNLKSQLSGIGSLMSSEESFARNQNRGYLSDFLLLRNYYIDFPDTNGSFMNQWTIYFTNQYVLICGYILSSISVVGLIYLLSQPRKLSTDKLSIILIFTLCTVALLSATPPFMQINQLLRSSDLINQIFRAPFTKFIVPTIFSFTLLTAFGLESIIMLFTKVLKYSSNIFTTILFAVYGLLITVYVFPIFQGHLFSSNLRQPIPQEYFDLFKYLQTKPSTARISNLPSGAFWGWTNYLWGYRGSGFIWYGLSQPILDRSFDTWNLTNEQYYWELDQAIQKKDSHLLSQVLKKYSIEYVLFDNSIYFPDEYIYSKASLSTQQLLQQTPGIQLDSQFGKISLYKTTTITTPYLVTNSVGVTTSNFFFEDSIFEKHQDYLENSATSSLDYPFLNLFSNRLQEESLYRFSVDSRNLVITRKGSNITQTIPIDDSVNSSKTRSKSNKTLSNSNGFQLLGYNFPQASLGKSYLVKVEYQHLTGLPLTISVNSDNLQQKYLYTKLDKKIGFQTAWFVLPARESGDFNQGITIIFNNSSFSKLLTQNRVFDVNLYPIPYFDLIQQSTSNSDQVSSRTDLPFTSNIFYYQVKVPTDTTVNSNIVLPQSFSSGWLAFYFNKHHPVFLKNHVLVNNWANGWQLPVTDYQLPITIYLFFWPQLLEFIGLLAIPTTFFWFTRRSHA